MCPPCLPAYLPCPEGWIPAWGSALASTLLRLQAGGVPRTLSLEEAGPV